MSNIIIGPLGRARLSDIISNSLVCVCFCGVLSDVHNNIVCKISCFFL